MGIASAIGGFASKQIGDTIKERIFGGTPTDSWLEFYINMAIDLEQVKVSKRVKKVAKKVAIKVGISDADTQEEVKNVFDNYSFAKSLTDEYDKVIRGGKTLIGGMPVMWGNKPLMLATLLTIMQAQSVSKDGDLLAAIGPAIQAYWTPAFLTVYETPSIPCIGAVSNIHTIFGMNLGFGIWTPIKVPAMGSVQPFLLNFIASAALHLLTIPGIIVCDCVYPPPAPPAPGVLPFLAYFVNPISIGSGDGLAAKVKSTLQKNLKVIINKVTDPKTIKTLGADVLAVLIEKGLTGDDTSVSSVVAKVVTDVVGGLVEGGKLQSADIEKNINDAIITTEKNVADVILPKSFPPDVVDVVVEPPKSIINAGNTNAGG
jgi:hypothetical protein